MLQIGKKVISLDFWKKGLYVTLKNAKVHVVFREMPEHLF
jgi:hypothetical protein